MAKLLLALALLVMAGVGGAQRNPPQVTQHPNMTNIEVKGKRLTYLRYRVCDDEEPSAMYTFDVHFFTNNQTYTKGCYEGFADFLHNGYGCSLQLNIDNQSCNEILIGAWNAHEYDTLCISIDIFYTSGSEFGQVIYNGDFFLTFLPESTICPTPSATDTTSTTDSNFIPTNSIDIVAVCANQVSENREQERNHILLITVPFIGVLLGTVILLLISIAIICVI